MTRIRSLFIAASVILALSPASSLAGGLVISIDNVSGPTGGQGTFEVLLSNTNAQAGESFDVAAFSFELMVAGSSGVRFTDATTSTLTAPYLFDGTGGASVEPGFTLSLDPFSNTGFIASDAEFVFPGITLAPGDAFGLGLVSFEVLPQAPSGDVQVSFVVSGTSLSDPNGGDPGLLRADDTKGIIHVAGTAVPEPSSLVLGAISVCLLWLQSRRAIRLSGMRARGSL